MPLSPCRILFILTIAHLLFIQLTAQHEDKIKLHSGLTLAEWFSGMIRHFGCKKFQFHRVMIKSFENFNGCSLAYFCRINFKKSLSSNLKRKCFQCTMPYECNLGLCYGDYCIKSLASDQYVSKGCENKTFRLVNGESYMQGSSESIEKSHCTTEYMFGIENVICYCNDIDFCNRSRKIEGRM
ncbi:Phenol 2-monooxygenase, oxygenase component MhpL [Dirofilaria immitis]